MAGCVCEGKLLILVSTAANPSGHNKCTPLSISPASHARTFVFKGKEYT